MSNEVGGPADIEAAIEQAKEWVQTIPDGQLGAALKRKFIEVGAFMHLAPAEMQHEMLLFLGTTVLRMPLFVLATGQYDSSIDVGKMHGLVMDLKAQFSPNIAAALGPIAKQLHDAADGLAAAADQSGNSAHTQVLYDSTKGRGQA